MSEPQELERDDAAEEAAEEEQPRPKRKKKASDAKAAPPEPAPVEAGGALPARVAYPLAVLCGVLPALEASRFDSADTLKESGRSGSVGRRQRLIFNALVTAQFALAVILLIAGGLLARSFWKLMNVDAGIRADGG